MNTSTYQSTPFPIGLLNQFRRRSLLENFLDPDFIPPPRAPETKRKPSKQLPAPLPDIAWNALVRHANHAEQLHSELQTLQNKQLSREQLTKADIARLEYLKKILNGGGMR